MNVLELFGRQLIQPLVVEVPCVLHRRPIRLRLFLLTQAVIPVQAVGAGRRRECSRKTDDGEYHDQILSEGRNIDA